MATYTKFNSFVEYLADKVMDFVGSPIGDTLKIMLTNSAPVATNTVKANLTEIGTGSGYNAGGTAVANVNGTRSTGTLTIVGDAVTFTASGGTIGPFQYAVLYDDTPSSPADPLIAFWDYGSAITLQNGETFTVKFSNQASGGTIFTLA